MRRRNPTRVTPTDYATLRNRARAYMASRAREHLCGASEIAGEIWPGHRMTGQGAAGAAHRILTRMQREGLVGWTSHERISWGWYLTTAGRKRTRPQEPR